MSIITEMHAKVARLNDELVAAYRELAELNAMAEDVADLELSDAARELLIEIRVTARKSPTGREPTDLAYDEVVQAAELIKAGLVESERCEDWIVLREVKR